MRDAVAAREMVRAIQLGVSPAIDAAQSQAMATALARIIAPCSLLSTEESDIVRRAPERALSDPSAWHDPQLSLVHARGASAFFDWLDARYAKSPGGLIGALYALVPVVSVDPFGFAGQPDTMDVLRFTFRNVLGRGSTFDDFLLHYAVERAAPERLAAHDTSPALAWHVPWPTAPRRLLGPPLAPTGVAYVLIDRAGAPPRARLRLELFWEEHAAMRVTVAKLDARGKALARVPLTGARRATELVGSVAEVDSADKLLVVVMNAGDEREVFEPGQGAWEPHAFTITLSSEE